MQTTETPRILAYTYPHDRTGAYQCIDCTNTRHGSTPIPPTGTSADRIGGNIVHEDSAGYLVYPLFSLGEWIEWQDFDESFLTENPIQQLTCGDCLKIITTYKHQGTK